MYRRGKRGIWQISVGGVRRSSETTDRERARVLEHKLNAEAWDRRNGLIAPTWDQACLAWLDDHPAKAKDARALMFMRWWKAHLSGWKLDAITPKAVNDIILKSRAGVSLAERSKPNSTANQYVAFVAQVIRHVSNLKPRFQVYPPMLGNDRWLSPEEWTALASQFSEDERDIFTFFLATGQREANVMRFQWDWWQGNFALIPSSDTKSRKPYGIPLNRTAQSILEKRQQAKVKHLQLVFTDAGRTWYRLKLLRALKRASQAAGLPYVTVHGLRHTFGTWLARSGVPKDIRQRLMGHAAGDVHDRYIHYDVESLRPYAELIDAQLCAKSSKADVTG